MTARIDRIRLTLTVYESFEGRREITFDVDVTDQYSPLVQAVRDAWQAHSEAQVAEMRKTGSGPIELT